MGFVWSMGQENPDEPSRFVRSPPIQTISLDASVGGAVVASTDLTRKRVADGVTHRSVRTDHLVGHYYEPAGSGPYPGVVALHGNGNRPMRNYGRLLASHGVATLAVKWFGEAEPLPDELLEVPVSQVERMVSWLGDRESVDGVGLLGHSKGAEYALLAASQYEAVDAVVVIAPSAYAFAPPGPAPEASSWTIDGEEVYPLPREASGRPPREQGKLKLAPMARTDIEAASQSTRDEAAIPVENISGDVLLIGGGDDGVWPVGLMMDHLVSRLDRKGFDHEVERLFYEQAGQVITIPYKPTTAQHYGGDIWAGGTPRAAAMAEADA